MHVSYKFMMHLITLIMHVTIYFDSYSPRVSVVIQAIISVCYLQRKVSVQRLEIWRVALVLYALITREFCLTNKMVIYQSYIMPDSESFLLIHIAMFYSDYNIRVLTNSNFQITYFREAIKLFRKESESFSLRC
jgi:hypothetical protein